uniref:Uncharacterized protein n=1 Tax=Rhizophora mucronata TaxID=61149 RepID=A0A2P2IJQ0_RHIMU
MVIVVYHWVFWTPTLFFKRLIYLFFVCIIHIFIVI